MCALRDRRMCDTYRTPPALHHAFIWSLPCRVARVAHHHSPHHALQPLPTHHTSREEARESDSRCPLASSRGSNPRRDPSYGCD